VEPSLDDITALTQQVCESVLGMSAEFLDGAPVPPRTEVMACVQITGGWQGAVVVTCPLEVAEAITAAMFELDPGAASQEELDDAMGEMANMIGGNIKGLLPGPSQLSLPTVAEGRNFSAAFPGAELAVEALYALEAGPLGIQVLRQDAHGGGAHERSSAAHHNA
jgi:chemotaxis protein CheX